MKIKCNSQQIAKDIYGSVTSLDRSIHLEEWEMMLDEKYKSNSKYNKEYDQGNDKEFIGRRKISWPVKEKNEMLDLQMSISKIYLNFYGLIL